MKKFEEHLHGRTIPDADPPEGRFVVVLILIAAFIGLVVAVIRIASWTF